MRIWITHFTTNSHQIWITSEKSLDIRVMSHECQVVSFHWPLNCLLNSLCKLTSKKTSKFPIIGTNIKVPHYCPDSKVHGANMGPTWVLSAPDGPHVGPMNPAIMVALCEWLMDSPHQRSVMQKVTMSWRHFSRTIASIANVFCWLYPTLNKVYLILSYLTSACEKPPKQKPVHISWGNVHVVCGLHY